MVLKRLLGARAVRKVQAPARPAGDAALGLGALLRHGVTMQAERVQLLKQSLDKGLEFFENFNKTRLKLAFDSFDVEMKKALFEVIYLLHVNDPALAELKFRGVELEHRGGMVREKPYEATANLYVEGAPHGVLGIGELSEVFLEQFREHIRTEMSREVAPQSDYGWSPIVSIHSLGSIGTVGHKSRASDLDLQIQYELTPFLVDTSGWDDQKLRDGLTQELRLLMGRLRTQLRLAPEALKDPATQKDLRERASAQLKKIYPNLFKYLMLQAGNYAEELLGPEGKVLKTHLLHEMMRLITRLARISQGEALKKSEALLKERIRRIQEYLIKKYPMAEVYLFSSSNDDYRKGHHGTTLENKEASGSAYELILNYETLMPGIQLTPVVPTHFIAPQMINDDAAMYERIVDYIRFDALEIYSEVRPRLVNLGPTPDMETKYVATHAGAVYWEAFKASSGNLPKALLNLFRYEMLLDKRLRSTIIQIIKTPHHVDALLSPKPEDPSKDLKALVEDKAGLPNWAIQEIEKGFPLLLQDPWWQRYKALKVGFGEQQGVPGLDDAERLRISKIIDLAFALHVRISDVFVKPGDTRPLDSHREQVLQVFLKRAFPPVSTRRQFLEHVFVGEVNTVNRFEVELRDLFKRCLQRVNEKIAQYQIPGESNQKEFEIWYHYYQENFEPAPNVIARNILGHLRVPRGRLTIGYRINKGWFFHSLQKESQVGKRFDTFGVLDHLPSEVTLMEDVSFLRGLADAVLNGYYGVLNEGTLKETRTEIEFDAKAMDLGNRTDNNLAFVRPDMVHRIVARIIEFFPYQPYHYMDCIRLKRKISELFILLNLTKFGRLSLLYRDNLRTWYVDEIDHDDLFNQSHNFSRSTRSLFMRKSLHVTLARFFKARGIKLGEIKLALWVNPNSVETSHSAKEQDLAEQFRQVIFQVHQPKGPGGQAPDGKKPETADTGADKTVADGALPEAAQ